MLLICCDDLSRRFCGDESWRSDSSLRASDPSRNENQNGADLTTPSHQISFHDLRHVLSFWTKRFHPHLDVCPSSLRASPSILSSSPDASHLVHSSFFSHHFHPFLSSSHGPSLSSSSLQLVRSIDSSVFEASLWLLLVASTSKLTAAYLGALLN